MDPIFDKFKRYKNTPRGKHYFTSAFAPNIAGIRSTEELEAIFEQMKKE